MSDLCPRCDRDTSACRHFAIAQEGQAFWNVEEYIDTGNDCHKHAVDWRARAFAAERRLADAERERDDLRKRSGLVEPLLAKRGDYFADGLIEVGEERNTLKLAAEALQAELDKRGRECNELEAQVERMRQQIAGVAVAVNRYHNAGDRTARETCAAVADAIGQPFSRSAPAATSGANDSGTGRAVEDSPPLTDAARGDHTRHGESLAAGNVAESQRDPSSGGASRAGPHLSSDGDALRDAARLLTRCLPYVSVAIGDWRADGDHKMAAAIGKLQMSMLAFIEEHGGGQ